MLIFFFFFSSRRRHTRCGRDWSSDVCSSDLGSDTCWNMDNTQEFGFLSQLENIIKDRKDNVLEKDSYVASLFEKGINKIAQKVGEEAVEVVIEAKDNNDDLFLNESADLLFHYLILLQAKGFQFNDIIKVLEKRHLK